MKKRMLVILVLVSGALAGFIYHSYRPQSVQPATNTNPWAGVPREVVGKVHLSPPVQDAAKKNVPVLVDHYEVHDGLGQDQQKPELQPASISGTVFDENAAGIAGATVKLTVLTGKAESDKEARSYSASTTPAGTYNIRGIDAFGLIRLTASREGCVTLDNGLDFIAGSPNLVRIAPGVDYKEIDFRLVYTSGYITGSVVDQSKHGIENAKIEIACQTGYKGSQGAYYGFSGPDGRFSIGLPGLDECTLVVKKEGYGTGHFPQVWPNTGDLLLELRSGGAIAGRVTNTKNEPLSGLDVLVEGESSPGYVGNPWNSTGRTATVSGKDGAYSAEDLSEDFTYTVRVPFPLAKVSALPEKRQSLSDLIAAVEQGIADQGSMAFDFGDLFEGMAKKTPVKVKAGEVTNVDLVIDDVLLKQTSIYGYVEDSSTGKPVCPLYVYACSQGPQNEILGQAITGLDGTYRILLSKLRQPTNIILRPHYYVDRLAIEESPEVVECEIQPGEEREVNFSIPGTVTAPIRLLSEDGSPIQGASYYGVTSNEEGRFSVYGLAPYVVHVLRFDEFNRAEVRTVLHAQSPPLSGKPGQTLPETTIVYEALGRVAGQIVLPEGYSEYPHEIIGTDLAYPDRSLTVTRTSPITPEGAFRIEELPEGACTILIHVCTDDPSYRWWALVENVQVQGGQTTDLGHVVLTPPQV